MLQGGCGKLQAGKDMGLLKLTIGQRQQIFFYRRKIILNEQFTFSKEINVNDSECIA